MLAMLASCFFIFEPFLVHETNFQCDDSSLYQAMLERSSKSVYLQNIYQRRCYPEQRQMVPEAQMRPPEIENQLNISVTDLRNQKMSRRTVNTFEFEHAIRIALSKHVLTTPSAEE